MFDLLSCFSAECCRFDVYWRLSSDLVIQQRACSCCLVTSRASLNSKISSSLLTYQVLVVWGEPPRGFQLAERCVYPHGIPGEDFEEGRGWLGIGASSMGSPLPLAEPQHPPDPHPLGRVLQPHQPAGQCACHWIWGIHRWWAFYFGDPGKG